MTFNLSQPAKRGEDTDRGDQARSPRPDDRREEHVDDALRLLERLREVGPAGITTGELIREGRYGLRPPNRVKDLRDGGHDIETRRESHGVARFVLLRENPNAQLKRKRGSPPVISSTASVSPACRSLIWLCADDRVPRISARRRRGIAARPRSAYANRPSALRAIKRIREPLLGSRGRTRDRRRPGSI
jgi:hypothetical protein